MVSPIALNELIEDVGLEIRFCTSQVLNTGWDSEPDQFVHRVRGSIFNNQCGDVKPMKIGTMSLVIFDLGGGMNAGFNPFEVIDALDQSSSDYG